MCPTAGAVGEEKHGRGYSVFKGLTIMRVTLRIQVQEEVKAGGADGQREAKGLWVGSLHEMKDGGMAGGGIE